MNTRGMPEKPDDTVAWITVRLHATGTISIAGTIGDRRMAHQLLDHARDAITSQIPDNRAIVVPNRDVVVEPISGLREMGDIPKDQRGDS